MRCVGARPKVVRLQLSIAQRSRPKPGESQNGDAVVVRKDDALTLMAVIDALGHGPRAALVATHAVRHLEHADLTRGAAEVLAGLHAALHGTRGAAAVVALFDGRTLEYGGVGNVEMRCVGSRIEPGVVDGILGQRVRRFRTCRTTMAPGDRIAVFSDGISGRFTLANYALSAATAVCEDILRSFARPLDDASLLVADFFAVDAS